MDIETALQIAKNFVTYTLKGDAGSMEPTSATYDNINIQWIIKYYFYKETSEAWSTAIIVINDTNNEITEFKVVEG